MPDLTIARRGLRKDYRALRKGCLGGVVRTEMRNVGWFRQWMW